VQQVSSDVSQVFETIEKAKTGVEEILKKQFKENVLVMRLQCAAAISACRRYKLVLKAHFLGSQQIKKYSSMNS